MTQKQFGKYRKIKFLLAALVACGLLSLAHSSSVRAASTITVNSTSDAVANDGVCTLREAIIAANTDTASGAAAGECVAGSGADTINFNITGTADFTNHGQNGYTIKPTSALPGITERITIDGYSQPGASANTAVAPTPLNGTILVELDGSLAGSTDGISINTSATSSVVKGLSVNSFGFRGIVGGISTTIQGNYIGVDATGLVDKGNSNFGVQSGANLLLGGLNPADRNIISGNGSGGASPNTGDDNWIVQGNYIGVDATGLVALSNSFTGGDGGLSLDNSSGHLIGGSQVGATNVISGNLSHGIAPDHADNLTIENNYIGTGYDGTTAIPNGSSGSGGTLVLGNSDNVLIKNNILSNAPGGVYVNDSTNVTLVGNKIGVGYAGSETMGNGTNNIDFDNGSTGIIGGVLSADANIIANAVSGPGVSVRNGSQVSILGNKIYDNNGLGIDVSPNGIIPENVHYTELADNTTVSYSLDLPAGDYRIEFFSNTTADSSGYGEGETYLSFQNVTSNGSGAQSFSKILSGTSIPNISLTITAIDGTTASGFGSTSEFSAIATPPPPVSDISVTNTLTNPQDVAQGATLNYATSFKNNGPDPFDITPYALGGQPLFYYAVHPDLTATGLGSPGPYPGTNFIANSGNPDITCLWAPGSYGAFFGSTTYPNYSIIACFYAGSDTTLASGASFNLSFSFTVDPSSNLQFGTYAFGGGGEGDPDTTVINNHTNSGEDVVDIATTTNINNFAAAVFPIPVQPGGGSSTTTPTAPVSTGSGLADTGENVWLIALASAVLILASIAMIWKWRNTHQHKV